MAPPHLSGQLIPLTVTVTVYVSSGAAWTGLAAQSNAAAIAKRFMDHLLDGFRSTKLVILHPRGCCGDFLIPDS
jgi:hypothetical protein